MTVHDYELLAALRRQHFELFLVKAFETLHPGDPPLELAWYLRAICHAFAEVRAGNERRLVVTVPPRHLKSVTASVAFVAWVLGHDPKAKIMVASYSQDLARHHSNQTRTLMESAWYQRDFPATRIMPGVTARSNSRPRRGACVKRCQSAARSPALARTSSSSMTA